MTDRPPEVDRLVGETVSIVAYDPSWLESFEAERQHLLACIPAGIIGRIEHAGSTAVPGLDAKPIIDVLVEVRSLAEVRELVVPLLEAQGYEYCWRPTSGDDGEPFYAWFIRRDPVTGARTHHIHMVEASFTEHWDWLVFRDHLISHPGTAAEYAALKRHLAAEFPNDREAYTEGKTAFITGVTQRAKAERAAAERRGKLPPRR